MKQKGFNFCQESWSKSMFFSGQYFFTWSSAFVVFRPYPLQSNTFWKHSRNIKSKEIFKLTFKKSPKIFQKSVWMTSYMMINNCNSTMLDTIIQFYLESKSWYLLSYLLVFYPFSWLYMNTEQILMTKWFHTWWIFIKCFLLNLLWVGWWYQFGI